jgi:hypothetical protein
MSLIFHSKKIRRCSSAYPMIAMAMSWKKHEKKYPSCLAKN